MHLNNNASHRCPSAFINHAMLKSYPMNAQPIPYYPQSCHFVEGWWVYVAILYHQSLYFWIKGLIDES